MGAIVFIILIFLGLGIVWGVYGYRNPTSKPGLFLIEVRFVV